MKYKLIAVFVVLVIVSMLGCTNDGNETDKNLIKVGSLMPWTGPWSWLRFAHNGIDFAVDQVNKSGGISIDNEYYKLKVISGDSETKQSTSIAVARKLIDVDDVIAIIGPTSATIRSIIPLIKEAGMLMISPFAGTTAIDNRGGGVNDEHVYRTVSSDIVMGAGMTYYAKNDLSASRVALFFTDDEGARSIAGVIKDAAKILGLTIVEEIYFPSSQVNYRSELSRLIGKDIDAVFFESDPQTASTYWKNYYELYSDQELHWIGTDFMNEPFAEATRTKIKGEVFSTSEGVIGIKPGPERDEVFYKWLMEYLEFTGKEKLDPYVANNYDATILIALALEKAGINSRRGLIDNIRSVASPPGEIVYNFEDGARLLKEGKEINYDGIAGPNDFNRYGDPIASLQVDIIKNGELTRLNSLSGEGIDDLIENILSVRERRSN